MLTYFSFVCSVGLYAQQQNVILLDNWHDTTILKGPEDARYSDVWAFENKSEKYCVIGSTIGHHIFKIANKSLALVDYKPGKFQSFQVIHRDYKTYKNYLYAVCDEGQSSLQVYDFSALPDSISLVYEDSLTFQSCHNIFIDTATAKLYACGPNDQGMKIFSLEDPESPTLIYDFNAVNYVHDCFVRNDTAYLNCGFDGLQVYYFGGPVPIQLGLIDFYPEQGYNHSGWLSPSGESYVFIDETEGTKIKYCNVNDLAQIHINEQFKTDNYINSVPHNVFLLDNLAFISYYNEGLRIYDTGNKPIKEIAYYDTFQDDTNYKLNGAWGVFVIESDDLILISDRQNGLFLFEFPVRILNGGQQGTFVTQTPFIDENSILLTQEHFLTENLTFSIATIAGEKIYSQESYNNWVNIPLDISAGVYVYSIFDMDKQLVESGKFVKAN